MLGYEGMDVINPEGGKDDAEEEAQRGRWKQEKTVQHECIPQAILGMDVICQAKSGMGKTAVFVLSTLQQIEPVAGQVAALVMCHTRELAYQSVMNFESGKPSVSEKPIPQIARSPDCWLSHPIFGAAKNKLCQPLTSKQVKLYYPCITHFKLIKLKASQEQLLRVRHGSFITLNDLDRNSKRRAILLGVGALALSSCPASSLFAEEIPQNYEAFVNKSDGYSYYYPSDWRMGALNDHLLPFNEEPSVNDSTLKSKGSTSSAEERSRQPEQQLHIMDKGSRLEAIATGMLDASLSWKKITNCMKKLEKVSGPLFTGLSAFLCVDWDLGMCLHYPDEDDDAEFYRDACEERRVLAHPTYYCKDCHYVAHCHCTVSEKWRFHEIIHILEEEWSEQESNRAAEQVEEPTSLTLKQFLDSFNGDEKKEVQGAFDAYRRDSQGDSSDNPKDSLYLDKASTEIMKILVSKNQVTMPWENWNSTSKLIKVDDYMILENLAPILGTLFGKYGDFSGMSNLSPKAKMLYIMTVCDAVNCMLSTKVKDITTNLLLSWFHCFMLGHYASFEIQFAFGRLTRVVRSHFGLQANVSTNLTLAKLDEEIGEQRALLDSKEVIDSEQDREIDKLRERIASMQLTSSKVHKEIAELHKKIKTLEEKHAISRFTEECLSDSLELEGQTAGMGLL
ncbi:unnamed protein product [Camellia sinensis]